MSDRMTLECEQEIRDRRAAVYARVKAGDEIHTSTLLLAYSEDTGTLLSALAAERQAVRRVIAYMEDAPELWGNPAVDEALSRLRALLEVDGE